MKNCKIYSLNDLKTILNKLPSAAFVLSNYKNIETCLENSNYKIYKLQNIQNI